MAFGAFQAFFTLSYLPGVSASDISWIGTVQSSLLIGMGLAAGPLYDLGYWRLLITVGSFMTVFGLMMVSISTTYWQLFLSLGLCIGIGCGLLYIPCLGLLSTSFSENRAVAMGVSTAGIALGGIIYTIVFLRLIDRVGFGWTIRTIAFVCLLAFIVAAPTVLREHPKSGRVRTLFDRAAFGDGRFVVFTAAQFFLFVGYMVPFFYVPTFAQVAIGTSQTTSLYILVGMQASSLLARLLSGYIGKVYGVMLPWTFSSAVSMVLCFAWVATDNLGSLVAFAVLYGFFSGALIAMPPGVFPKICPDPSKMGSRMGISWTFVAIAMLVGSPIAGVLVDLETKAFVGAQVWSGATLGVGVLLQVVVWISLAKKFGTWQV